MAGWFDRAQTARATDLIPQSSSKRASREVERMRRSASCRSFFRFSLGAPFLRLKYGLRSGCPPVRHSLPHRSCTFSLPWRYYAGSKQNAHHAIRGFLATTARSKGDTQLWVSLEYHYGVGQKKVTSERPANSIFLCLALS